MHLYVLGKRKIALRAKALRLMSDSVSHDIVYIYPCTLYEINIV